MGAFVQQNERAGSVQDITYTTVFDSFCECPMEFCDSDRVDVLGSKYVFGPPRNSF